MKKTIAILAVSTICGMTNGQSLPTNAQKYPQLKMIADKLNSITTYQAHCDLFTTDSERGPGHYAATLFIQKVPTDTLCGFYYYFKTDEKYKKNDINFIAFFNNAVYYSEKNAINKYTLLDDPMRKTPPKFTRLSDRQWMLQKVKASLTSP